MNETSLRRRLLVIFNPTVGGRRRRRFAAAIACLHRCGCQVTVRATTAAGDAERFAAEADPGSYDALVVAGGDGTVNEAINGLAGSDLPLAVIPLGTANVLAAELGIGRDPAAIARTIVAGPAKPVTVGAVDGRRFTLMLGAGFDAHVVATVNPPVKRRFGRGAYALAILRQLRTYRFPSYRVTIDGEVRQAASVLVANAHFYGGRFIAAPTADLFSPTLDVGLFERSGRLAAIGYALALFLGFLPALPSYRLIRARRLVIEGPAGDPVQGDGDVIARLPVEVVALPRALHLIFPPERHLPATDPVVGTGRPEQVLSRASGSLAASDAAFTHR